MNFTTRPAEIPIKKMLKIYPVRFLILFNIVKRKNIGIISEKTRPERAQPL